MKLSVKEKKLIDSILIRVSEKIEYIEKYEFRNGADLYFSKPQFQRLVTLLEKVKTEVTND